MRKASPNRPRFTKKRVLNIHKNKESGTNVPDSGGPSGARTLDPNIKSVVLYQLS